MIRRRFEYFSYEKHETRRKCETRRCENNKQSHYNTTLTYNHVRSQLHLKTKTQNSNYTQLHTTKLNHSLRQSTTRNYTQLCRNFLQNVGCPCQTHPTIYTIPGGNPTLRVVDTTLSGGRARKFHDTLQGSRMTRCFL
jgi:hypothetical protein